MRFVVSGRSMEPSYFNGDKLFVSKFLKPKAGDAVVVEDPRTGRMVLKRIERIEEKKYFVVGDNPIGSTDSRTFGGVSGDSIVGKVIVRYSSPR